MKRSEKRTMARQKRMKMMHNLTERFFAEMDKVKPDKNGHISTGRPLTVLTAWLEKMRDKYPQEASFFIEVGASWTKIFAQTCIQYAKSRKAKAKKKGGENDAGLVSDNLEENEAKT